MIVEVAEDERFDVRVGFGRRLSGKGRIRHGDSLGQTAGREALDESNCAQRQDLRLAARVGAAHSAEGRRPLPGGNRYRLG
jgi:hypothetical protein